MRAFPRVPSPLVPGLVAAATLAGWWFRWRVAPDEPIWDGWRYQMGAEALASGSVLTWNHVGFSALAVPFLPFWGARAAWALSMLAGVAAIPVAYALVARVTTPVGGVAAAWLLAFTPVHAYWSGTGHAGTLALLLALLATLAAYAGRGVLVLALVLAGVTVRPDFIVYAPLLMLLPRLDARVPDSAARPLLTAAPVLLAVSAVYFIAHGGRPGRVAWTVPPEHVPADWAARAERLPDGSLGLGAAYVPWSPAYALPNLAFYAGVLLDWSLPDWSGWVTYLPPNPLLTPLAVAGALVAPRRHGASLALVTVPCLGTYAFYYGFSPEYAFPVLVPALLAAGGAVAAGAAPFSGRRTRMVLPPLRDADAGGPSMFKKVRSLVGERGDIPDASEDPARRVVLLVLLGIPRAHGPLRDLVPHARTGRLAAVPDADTALTWTFTSRAEAVPGRDPALFRAILEHDVPFTGVNVPERFRAARGRYRGPGLDADAAAQGQALVEAAEAGDWRALVGVVNAAAAPEDRAWAIVEDALARVRRTAGEDALFLVMADDGENPEVLVTAPGIPRDHVEMDHVSWVDACPTVLRALDLNVPDDLEGFPLEEAFPADEWNQEDEQKVREHLEKLGYL